MIKTLLTLLSVLALSPLSSQTRPDHQTIRYNLSGTDKDHTIDWDFFCTKGRKSGSWTKIAVPSNWEQQGFGAYNYGLDKGKADEEGLYKYSFKSAPGWENKKVFIVFEGSMTDTEVKINGVSAGDIHQGGFYRFKYDITSLIRTKEENLLEVKVSKMSSNASVNKAERGGDFWVFGGIYRPVYLEIVPLHFIDRVAIDAGADGKLNVEVYPSASVASPGKPGTPPRTTTTCTLTARVQRLDGSLVGEPFTAGISPDSDKTTLTKKITGIKAWNPEFPTLYDLVVTLVDPKGSIHTVKQRFGFRTVDIRKKDGIYVNGKKVILKGITHHSEWPESGRTLSKKIDLLDVGLIKEMNINAVRMSHYPPDQSFLDLSDSLGLFVLDELTGWQAKYDTTVGRKLVKELVVRDVNHPSVILWDNGNEGGWNRALDNDFALYDPQRRTVIHPWERFNGFDTKHYPVYNYVVNAGLYDDDIFLPTEFMHGLYDGGLGAGLDDFWNRMMENPACAGGFMWAFLDEAVARTDKNGWLDTDGNHAPDGIVGPHREKEGSFYTVKEIWSPVYIKSQPITPDFDGRLAIENRYLYTNLNRCSFSWKLVSFPSPRDKNKMPRIDASGRINNLDLPAGEKGFLPVKLPSAWRNSDVLYITASDPYQKEIYTWSRAIRTPHQRLAAFATGAATTSIGPSSTGASALSPPITAQEGTDALVIRSGEVTYSFDNATGRLQKVVSGNKHFALSNGPVQAGVPHTLRQLVHYASGNDHIVEPKYESDSFTVKWVFSPGKPARLEYSYLQKNDAAFTGITFDYPEEKITGMTWLGGGPYRVWKNRLKGATLNVWHKDYNNTVTGESWLYPEFKGYHSDLYWVTVEQGNDSFTVYTENDHVFLQMGKPQNPAGAGNTNTSPAFPEGSLGFMNSISPIGTKFKPAVDMGPQSQSNMMLNYTPVSGTLWFDFR